jgi:predicted ATPase
MVELACTIDPLYVPDVIARTLRTSLDDQSASFDSLQRYLRSKHMLLVLDNFEHLLDAAPMVVDLLIAAPRLTVLVTSRERLHVSGEQEYPVQPLPVPIQNDAADLQRLLKNDSIKLFLQRAQAASCAIKMPPRWLKSACAWTACPWRLSWLLRR